MLFAMFAIWNFFDWAAIGADSQNVAHWEKQLWSSIKILSAIDQQHIHEQFLKKSSGERT